MWSGQDRGAFVTGRGILYSKINASMEDLKEKIAQEKSDDRFFCAYFYRGLN